MRARWRGKTLGLSGIAALAGVTLSSCVGDGRSTKTPAGYGLEEANKAELTTQVPESDSEQSTTLVSTPSARPLLPACEFQLIELDESANLWLDSRPIGSLKERREQVVPELWDRVGPCFLRVLTAKGLSPHRVRLQGSTPLWRVHHLLATLFHAGFSTFRVESNDEALVLRLAVLPESLSNGASPPVPPSRPPAPAPPKLDDGDNPFSFQRPGQLLLIRVEDEQFELVWAAHLGQANRGRLVVPRSTGAPELRALFERECAGSKRSCQRVVIEAAPDIPWQDIAHILRAMPRKGNVVPLLEVAFLDQSVVARVLAQRLLGNEPDIGEVDRAAVERHIHAALPAVAGCYQERLKWHPKLAGHIVLRLWVERDGRVGEVGDVRMGNLPKMPLEGPTISDSGLVSCVRKAFEGLKLPAPNDGPALILYPINLTPP